jgi:hypothetical protein
MCERLGTQGEKSFSDSLRRLMILWIRRCISILEDEMVRIYINDDRLVADQHLINKFN